MYITPSGVPSGVFYVAESRSLRPTTANSVLGTLARNHSGPPPEIRERLCSFPARNSQHPQLKPHLARPAGEMHRAAKDGPAWMLVGANALLEGWEPRLGLGPPPPHKEQNTAGLQKWNGSH
jgi:hypothetical protein